MTAAPKSELRALLQEVANDAETYFADTRKWVTDKDDSPFGTAYRNADHYWDMLSEELREAGLALVERLLAHCAALAEATRTSPLTGDEDMQDVKVAAKAMRAAVRLRRYTYQEPSVIHDEDVVLGFRRADQSETHGLSPSQAESEFFHHASIAGAVLKLLEASPGYTTRPASSAPIEGTKYRSGTAFIMMWMDPEHPELADVAETVRNVFRLFDVRAVRADDIEHEGLISERVLNEIRTCEFLFADLTGTRPNVYYEVGYAHALGKRVILFRKSGTGIHFDLSGYNCPEYVNQMDLRKKLTKRLVELTNRNPNDPNDI